VSSGLTEGDPRSRCRVTLGDGVFRKSRYEDDL